MPLLLILLFSVTLSAPFGEASAKLVGFTPTEVTVEVSVEVVEGAAIVLMRGVDVAGNELDPVALISRGDGTWGAVVELPARSDLRLLFELIPERGASRLSEASSLANLGIDPELLTLVDRPEPAEEETTGPGLAWIVVAVVAALAALGLIVFWSRSGVADPGDSADATNLADSAEADSE